MDKKTLLVESESRKTFRLTVPADARITFGPFSPPTAESKGYRSESSSKGTLRIYAGGTTKAMESILACFTGVTSFRDVTNVEYEERVATEEVRTVWKSDAKGYRTEVVAERDAEWRSDPALLKAVSDSDDEAEQF